MTRSAVLSDEFVGADRAAAAAGEGPDGPPMRDHRLLVEGAVYRYRTGIAWRDLPAEFGPWQTVWKRHHRFAVDGTWDRVLTALHAAADAAGDLDWRVSVDSTVVRGAPARRDRPEVGDDATSYTGGSTE